MSTSKKAVIGQTEYSLANFSNEELAEELARRENLQKPDGLLTKPLWDLRVKLGKIVCVDSFAVRERAGVPEVSAIVRNTGQYAGKYCLIGGVVAGHESIEEALRRHWRTDVGVEVEMLRHFSNPYVIHQDMPPDSAGNVQPGFNPEPSKWNIGLVYPVRITGGKENFGETEHGGQEARELVWFSLNDLPKPEAFAYGFHDIYERYLCS